MREQCGIPLPVEEIEARVIGELRHRYRHELSVYPGAEDVVERLAARYLLGVASSSPRELIETALEVAGLRGFFAAVVSSDDVSHGKPEPDVYLMACELLAVPPSKSAAIEDSGNGIMSAFAAGLAVVAIPNKEFPPPPQVVSLAEKVLASISELNVDVIASLTGEVSND
jgi:HAD superfamily hydrolase (TIGR01509 family)